MITNGFGIRILDGQLVRGLPEHSFRICATAGTRWLCWVMPGQRRILEASGEFEVAAVDQPQR